MPPKRACKTGTTCERCGAHNAAATLYCSTCRCVACLQCLEQDLHSHHDILSLKKAHEEFNEQLQSALSKAEQILRDGSMLGASAAVNPIAGRLASMVERVQNTAQQLHRAVDAFETSLVARVLQCAGTTELERADERLAQTCFEESLRALVHKAATCGPSEMALACKAQLIYQVKEAVLSHSSTADPNHAQNARASQSQAPQQGGPAAKRARTSDANGNKAIKESKSNAPVAFVENSMLGSLKKAVSKAGKSVGELSQSLNSFWGLKESEVGVSTVEKELQLAGQGQFWKLPNGEGICICKVDKGPDSYKLYIGSREMNCFSYRLKGEVNQDKEIRAPRFTTRQPPIAISLIAGTSTGFVVVEKKSAQQSTSLNFSVYREAPYIGIISFIPAESNDHLPLLSNSQTDILVARGVTQLVFAGRSSSTQAHVLALLELVAGTPIKSLRTINVESCVQALAYNAKLHKLCVSLEHAIAVFDDDFTPLQHLTCSGTFESLIYFALAQI